VASLFAFIANADDVQKTEITYSFGTNYSLNSSTMDEVRQVFVHLPDNYQQTNQTYPVLYLLDGDDHFTHAVTSARNLYQHNMAPQMIIVAIANNKDTRRRDLTANRQNFMAFVLKEVPGFIQKNFRVNDTQILFGHSAMGGLSLYFMRDKDTDIFDHYIVAGPSMGMKSVNKLEETFRDRKDMQKSLYFTMGGLEDEQEFIQPDAVNALAALLDRSAPENLKWHFDELPEQTHMTTPYVTVYRGLTHIFSK